MTAIAPFVGHHAHLEITARQRRVAAAVLAVAAELAILAVMLLGSMRTSSGPIDVAPGPMSPPASVEVLSQQVR